MSEYIKESFEAFRHKRTEPVAPNVWDNSKLLDAWGFGYSILDQSIMKSWPDAVRGVPNAILRSALFGATRRGKRAYNEAALKASVGGVILVHTGPQLDQGDLDVWEQCLQLARGRPLGMPIQFTAGSFLKAIGRGTGKSQYEWLKSSLRRLMLALVEVKDGRMAYAGQLIHDLCRDEATGKHSICLNPRITALYGPGGWSWVDWGHRTTLQKSPLAQWLHGFYTSHAQAYPYKVETIHKLCGSESKNVTDFRKDLRKALQLLEEVAGWETTLDSSGIVRVWRKASKSQQRHLAKKQHPDAGTTA